MRSLRLTLATLALTATATTASAQEAVLKAAIAKWTTVAAEWRQAHGIFPPLGAEPDTDPTLGNDSAAIIKLLGSKLDRRDPGMDAYLKLRLINLKPKFEGLTDAQTLAIIKNMPVVTKINQPTSTQVRLLSKAEGELLAGKDLEKVKTVVDALSRTQARTRARNDPVMAFRFQLAQQIGLEDGARLLVMAQTAYDVYMAGEWDRFPDRGMVDSIIKQARATVSAEANFKDERSEEIYTLIISIKEAIETPEEPKMIVRYELKDGSKLTAHHRPTNLFTIEKDQWAKIEQLKKPIVEGRL